MATIKAIIGKDGEVSFEVDGVKGAACTDLTKPFEEACGVVSEQQLLPQYNELIDGIQIDVHNS